MPTKDQIVLHAAYVWDCPECGRREVFARAVEAELTDSERAELMRRMGIDDVNEGEEWKGEEFEESCGLVTMPDEVICPDCKTTFKVFCEPDTKMPPGFDPHKDLNA